MRRFRDYITEAKELTTDKQKSERAAHVKFHEAIPHLEGSFHEHSHSMHGLYSYGYTHEKNIPAIKKHLEDQGYSHEVEGEDHAETRHEFKHPDGRTARIAHFHKEPNDVEVSTRSKLSPNESKPGSRPGATKKAREQKQRSWNARYD